MAIQTRSFLIPLLSASLVLAAGADQRSAETLGRRLNGSVTGMDIHPVWAPDDAALYMHEADQILRIDTASGATKPMIDYDALALAAGGEEPRIERFMIADNGDFVCLVSADDRYATYRMAGEGIMSVKPEADPFALPAIAARAARSRSTGPESAVIFINNTDDSVQLFWADTGGIPQPYSTVAPGACFRQHTFSGHAWIAGSIAFVAQDEPGIAYLGAQPSELQPRRSARPTATGLRPIFRDDNLLVREPETGREVRLTSDGTAEWQYRGPALLSPDNRYMVVMREKAGDNRTIDLIEAAPRDGLQPRTVTISYPKPGDRIAQAKPCLFDLQSHQQIPIDDSLFPNPWAIDQFHWDPEGRRLFFVYNERGHQIVRLLALEAQTGKVTVVAEEKSPTFIDYTNKIEVHHLDETDEAIWMSERSGWNHLYLINRTTGRISPITSGEWVVRGIERIDEARREILFRAGGIHVGQDPYYVHYARIGFDGSGLTLLTDGDGTHTASFSPNGGYFVDTWSRVDRPPVHELRSAKDGHLVQELGRADISGLLAIDPHLPEPFRAKGRDGLTDIFGIIYRPTDFDPTRKYPVIERIYAGPQDYFVPKAFRPYRNEQRLAELGYIVVQIDGMGTNWRSKAFHDVCWKNLKDAGFPDRIAWMKAAAEKYPSMDLGRVGIYGTSAGGQSAMRAVIDHADFYKAAVADSGCHDNRMDKIWWNEQWMGWPVDKSYADSSNVEDAHRLGGKLLLTVGAMDTNVDPSSTYQVVDELIKAGKEFELMVFPSSGHGAGEGEYGTRLREAFFSKYLQ